MGPVAKAAIGLTIAATGAWLITRIAYRDQIYGLTQENAALRERVQTLGGEALDLNARIVSLSRDGTAASAVSADGEFAEPDALYAPHRMVARAAGGEILADQGVVRFRSIVGDAELDINQRFGYRTVTVGACTYSASSPTMLADRVVTQHWSGVTCRILAPDAAQ